ncbi:MAG: hypothetical protein ACREBE_25870 [bacterium]
MKTIVPLIFLAWIGCSAESPPPVSRAAQSFAAPLQLFRTTNGTPILTIQMTPDERVRNGAGIAVGTFDAASGLISISGTLIALTDVVRNQNDGRMELRLPIGTWLIDVAADGGVRVNGAQWGRVQGFATTPDAWQRLAALFAALPVMPSSERTPHRPPN